MISLWPEKTDPFRKVVTIMWIFAPIAIPLVANFGAWKMKKDDNLAKCVPFLPEPWMYTASWIFLLVCLAASWIAISSTTPAESKIFTYHTLMYLLLISGMVVWLWAYSKESKADALSVMVLLVFVLVMIIPTAYSMNPLGASLLLPLLVWLIFQLYVSIKDTECTIPPK